MFESLKKIPFVRPIYHFFAAFFAALIYGFPSKKLFVIGVTGTKGKTTVLELMNAVFEEAGEKTALLSSLRVKVDHRTKRNQTENTMPGRFFTQKFLREARGAGCRYAFLEVTSEGVRLSRHRFINWNVAFLINLHPEHIEAHGSFEKYRAAKLSFLKYAAQKKGIVFVNRNDKNADFFISSLQGARVVQYAKEDSAFLNAAPRTEGSFLAPDFNRDNAAAALALAKHLGVREEVALRAVQRFRGVAGRMEFVQSKPFRVVVDYAHTPDSLRAVYEILKPKTSISKSRLICVLGSAGGGRDKWKRPEMGKIAATYCDAAVITNEDPYDEDPESIMSDVESGMRESLRFDQKLSAMTSRILERREAIEAAISMAKKGDTVVVTGKGSEQWIHVRGGKKIPWSDSGVAKEVLKAKE